MSAEVASTSDTSTVDDGSNNKEVDILSPSQEVYSYLQGLDSGNLMQFSQQSVMNELIRREHLDIKPNLDILPTFEEHDIGGYKFQLNFRTKCKSKVNWSYSEALHKVYIRMGDTFNFEAIYTPKMPFQQLRLRVLISFVNEVSEPVLRCQNHISKDPESHPHKRHSLLRCDNPNAEYCGSAEGINLNDRYAILLPLAMSSVTGKEDNTVKQSIALKFTCQNSCIGRKETSLIFVLESMNGQILSQRVLDVKICSCPKRDRGIDERNVETTKRKMNADFYPRARKIVKKEAAVIKKERFHNDTEDDSDIDADEQVSLERTVGGGYRVVLESASRTEIQQIIDHAQYIAYKRAHEDSNRTTLYKRKFRRLQRLSDKCHKI